MRAAVCAAMAAAALVALPAQAQDDEESDKDAEPAKGAGGSLDSGSDPVHSEKSEKGPYSPRGKTGELRASAAADGETDEPDVAARRRGMGVFGELLAGFGGHVPIPSPGYQVQPAFTSYTVMLGAHIDVSPKITLAIRAPWSTVTIEEGSTGTPAGSAIGESASAFGSPEVIGEYRVRLSARATLPIQLGIGIPIANGDPDVTGIDDEAQRKWFANWAADAASGWRDGELFTPMRLPIAPALGFRYARAKLGLHGQLKVVVMPNLGGQITSPDRDDGGTYEIPGVALRAVLAAGATYRVIAPLDLGLDTWLVNKFSDGVEFENDAADAPSGLLWAFEPRLVAHFGRFSPRLGYLVFLNEQIGSVHALRIGVDAAF
jgi:hypothetical protein